MCFSLKWRSTVSLALCIFYACSHLVLQLLAICREYIVGLAMELERRTIAKDAGEEVGETVGMNGMI